jgi:tRNA dimethylallyltransferase
MSFPLIAVVGPTGSGKSHLALELAKRFSGEIVSCDSVQIYKDFNIGTAKLTEPQRQQIPHHLIDLVDPDYLFTAGEYGRVGRRVLEEIRRRNRLPIIAGGTGLYLKALLEGLFEGPHRSDELREEFYNRAALKGPAYLHRLLKKVDPISALRISPHDHPKLIRALEVFFLTAKPLSHHLRGGREPLRGYVIFKIGLNPPRKLLYETIDLRVEQMFHVGLIQEVQSLLTRGYSSELKPFQSLGYIQVVAHLKGELSLDEAIFSTQRETRRYAKRQMTWFRKEKEVSWFTGFGSDTSLQSSVFNGVEGFLKTGIQQAEKPHPFWPFDRNRSETDGHEIEAEGKSVVKS